VSRSCFRNRGRKGKRETDPVAARAGRRQTPESAEGHKVNSHRRHSRHRHALASSSLEYQATRVGVGGGGRGCETVLRDTEWRRIAGLRVVMSWPQSGYAPPPKTPTSLRARLAGVLGTLLIMGGVFTVGFVLLSQVHAPEPNSAAAGAIGQGYGPSLQRSVPVSVAIPAIGVSSKVLHLGTDANGDIAVPSIYTEASDAAWYKYSPTPGQIGASVIEGHLDNYQGPAVFFRLGALHI